MGNEIWNRLQYVLSPQFDIYEQASKIVNGRVADIGCGTGFGTNILARNAIHVDGYDFDPHARNFASRVFSNRKLHFWQGDIADPDWSCPKIYDYVLMIDVIEHIVQDVRAITNCKKMLKSGGTFILSTPNTLSRYRKSDNHIKEYKPSEIKGLLDNIFKEVEIVDYMFKPATSIYMNPIVVRAK